MKIKTELDVDEDRVADLLCAGMEGGIGYWARIVGYNEPPGDVWKGSEGLWRDDVFKHIHWPMSPGGAVYLFDAEETWEENAVRDLGVAVGRVDGLWVLNREGIERGLALMANTHNYSHHFANFMRENEDAETGDVFVQLCVLGEVVYG